MNELNFVNEGRLHGKETVVLFLVNGEVIDLVQKKM